MQIRAVIPPDDGTHPDDICMRRYSLQDSNRQLNIFESLYGVFKQEVTFPACEDRPKDTVWLPLLRAPTLFALSVKWTMQLMLQLAKGVALCHRIGVVHRDLAPWNALFDSFGRLKIIDFGAAQYMVRLPLLRQTCANRGARRPTTNPLSTCQSKYVECSTADVSCGRVFCAQPDEPTNRHVASASWPVLTRAYRNCLT
jgi:hypothetical protein